MTAEATLARPADVASDSGPAPRPRHVGVSALSALSLLIAAFLLHLLGLSSVEHARAQRLAYADFRLALSAVTAPTGQLDLNGALLALGTPVAYLDAPALGLEREVVLEGATPGVLTKGLGHRRSTVLPGQAGTSVLYGRAWTHGGPFGGLGDVGRGSLITVTTGQGQHVYKVTGVRRAGDRVPQPPDRAKGQGRLTLVSASGGMLAPDGAVYLDADLTTAVAPSAPLVLGATGLLPAEGVLARDETAWPAVFLLLQGFAAVALATTWTAHRFGGALAWLLGTPVLTLLAVLASREVVRLLPNLL